jgi:hypothetical protein
MFQKRERERQGGREGIHRAKELVCERVEGVVVWERRGRVGST